LTEGRLAQVQDGSRRLHRINFNPGAFIMNNLTSAFRSFVCASIATLLTGAMAYLVIDGTASSSRYDVAAAHSQSVSQQRGVV